MAYEQLSTGETVYSNDPAPGIIPKFMWYTSLLIASQSFLFGFVFSCLNSCLVTGDDNDGNNCYDGSDSTCPKGTIYNDINLSTGKIVSLCNSILLYG